MPGRNLRVTVGTVAGATASAAVSDGAGISDSVAGALTLGYDWAVGNEPWRSDPGLTSAQREALFTTSWPAGWDTGLTEVDISQTSGDLRTILASALASVSGRAIVRLPAGEFYDDSFEKLSTSEVYAFGFYSSKMAVLLCPDGPENTFINQSADSLTTAQLSYLQGMSIASGETNNLASLLLGGGDVFGAGFTLTAEDQQDLSAVAADLVAKGVVVPQPAPHHGIAIGQNRKARLSYFRVVGAGAAMYASTPFEHGSITQQYGETYLDHYEFDGRRASWIDPAQPWVCGMSMFNNPGTTVISDGWEHHAPLSRIAYNSSNANTQSNVSYARVKVEYIGNNHVRPDYNGGSSLGGTSAAACVGFESSKDQITWDHLSLTVDNTLLKSNVFSTHLSFTTVAGNYAHGANGPQGGRLTVLGGTFGNRAFPQLDGYLTVRVSRATYWYLDGYATTLMVYDESGARLTPWVYTGSTPPTSGQIAAAGISPSTHFIVVEIS